MAVHDDQNNARVNFRGHYGSTDTERGLPSVPKFFFDLRDMTEYVCIALTPDPTMAGGGTWVPNGSGGGPRIALDGSDFSFTQAGVTYECSGIGYYRTDGVEAWGNLALVIVNIDDPGTVYPSGVELFPILMVGWPVDVAAAPEFGLGMYGGVVDDVKVDGLLTVADAFGTTTGGLSGIGGDGITPSVLHEDDQLYLTFRYPI